MIGYSKKYEKHIYCWQQSSCILQKKMLKQSNQVDIVKGMIQLNNQFNSASLTMHYSTTSSSRLAAFDLHAHKLFIFNRIRAEGVISTPNTQDPSIAIFYQKTVTLYSCKDMHNYLQKKQINPKVTSTLNKKVQCMTFSSQGNVLLSDKFGDIYSLNAKDNIKYLNSNLGIPTFVEFIEISPQQRYLAIGDEESKIKIYNQLHMHQIKSLWFLIEQVPVELIQVANRHLIFLNKLIPDPTSKDNTPLFSLIALQLKQIQNEEFEGQPIERINSKDCLYQSIVGCRNECKFYVIELTTDKVKINEYVYDELTNRYNAGKNIEESLEVNDWNSLEATLSSDQKSLLIIIGQAYVFDQESCDTLVEEINLKEYQNQVYKAKINKNECAVVIPL